MYNYRGWNRTFCVCSRLIESSNLSEKAEEDKYIWDFEDILAQLVFAFRYAYNLGRLVTVLIYRNMKCNCKKFKFQ